MLSSGRFWEDETDGECFRSSERPGLFFFQDKEGLQCERFRRFLKESTGCEFGFNSTSLVNHDEKWKLFSKEKKSEKWLKSSCEKR